MYFCTVRMMTVSTLAPTMAMTTARGMLSPAVIPQKAEQPLADECADDSDDHVTDRAESAAAESLSRNPAGGEADHEKHEDVG